jgi:hypothetical protein
MGLSKESVLFRKSSTTSLALAAFSTTNCFLAPAPWPTKFWLYEGKGRKVEEKKDNFLGSTEIRALL